MYQFWVIQLLHLFLANFGIFAFVYIKSKKCYQSSAEGLLGYSAAIFAITSHNIYSNTLHSWIPRNIMGGIRKKISWHPELSQLLLLSLGLPTCSTHNFEVNSFLKEFEYSFHISSRSRCTKIRLLLYKRFQLTDTQNIQ